MGGNKKAKKKNQKQSAQTTNADVPNMIDFSQKSGVLALNHAQAQALNKKLEAAKALFIETAKSSGADTKTLAAMEDVCASVASQNSYLDLDLMATMGGDV